MGILQGIAYEDAVLIMLEDDLFLQDDSSHAIGGGRHLAGIKLTNVLVSLRTEIVALILVESEVEREQQANRGTCAYCSRRVSMNCRHHCGLYESIRGEGFPPG